MCTHVGYSFRIYLVVILVWTQTIAHLAIVITCFQIFWCYVLPNPTQIISMFAYMEYFYKEECMNLTQVGFPPNWTSPPSDYQKWLYSRQKDKAYIPESQLRSKYGAMGNKYTNEKYVSFINETNSGPMQEFQKPIGKSSKYRSLYEPPKHGSWLHGYSGGHLFGKPPWLTRPPWLGLPNWPKWLWYPSFLPGWPKWLSWAPDAPSFAIKWPRRAHAITSVYSWTIAYLVMDTSWLITSLILLVAAFVKIRGPISMCFYIPWIAVTICICFMDVIATGYFVSTIASTSSWFSFLKFMGVRNMDEVRDGSKMWFSDYRYQYIYPSVIATAFVSRLAFIWVVNVVLLLMITHIFRRVVHTKIIDKTVIVKNPAVVSQMTPPWSAASSNTLPDCSGMKAILPSMCEPDQNMTTKPRNVIDYLLDCC